MDEYYKALEADNQKKSSSGTGKPSFMDEYYKAVGTTKSSNAKTSSFSMDIAPLSDRIASRMTVGSKKKKKEEEEKKRKWFEKGLFEDGYDFGDISRTILGTTTDVLENVGSGIIGMGEKAVDAMAYIAPYAANSQFYQNGGFNLETEKAHRKAVEQSKDELQKFIAKDLYDEEKVARAIISDPARMIGIDSETQSVFGEKSDALIQSGGQLLATAGLQAVGVPWFVTTGVTSFGSETENAMNQGATYEQAGASAAISAGAEILSEKLSGGISFGGKTLDDSLTKMLARGISNKLGRTAAKLGLDMAGEGAEEVFSQIASNLGSSLYKEEDITELLFNEEAMDGYLESFIGGAALGGVAGSYNAVKSTKKGVDYTSGLTQNEQKVVDKLYQDEIASREKEGKVTQKEKSKIYDSILEDMDKGYISIGDIEKVLGGDSYKAYRDTVDYEDSIFKEYEELGEKPNATPKDYARYTELTEKIKDIHSNSQRSALRSKLTEDMQSLVKGDRLAESYNERYRSGQKFEADTTKYDAKQQAVIQKAIDSGILNNTNRTHEFVDFVSKISADTGVLFDFSNTEKLRESGYVMEGQTIDGFYNPKEGITVNIDSPKSRQFVVGHEITHALEGTELYDALRKTVFDYAKLKNQYGVRMESIQKRYKEGTDFEAELTADLVGEYIFSDTDFVSHLSTQNRNVFQKVYDEIKYLCKVATAGSKEARELERVKRAFEKAYREGSKAQTENYTETKYSLVEDQKTIDFLENQEHLTVYKAMSLVDGKLYAPMASQEYVDEEYTTKKGEKKTRRVRKLKNPSVLGKWQQSEERPDLIKSFKAPTAKYPDGYGTFDLLKSNGKTTGGVAYNPYEHTSNIVLNDQFAEAYQRPELVTVEYRIPVSELTSGYKALHAKDAVGLTDWKAGGVAQKLKNSHRDVYLTRWSKPVRVLSDAEVAQKYKEILDKETGISVPWNVVTPSLRHELEKLGVPIDYSDVKSGTTVKNFKEEMRKVGDVKYSLSDVSIDDLLRMTDEEFTRLYGDIEFELDDDILLDDDSSIESISEEVDAEPEVIRVLFHREGLGNSHVEDNRKAVMTQKRIDERIFDSGAGNTDYARRYITRISPKDFIDLTVYGEELPRTNFDKRVTGDHGSKMGEWDYEKQLRDSNEPPVLVVNKATGQIMGHNGRHRVRALEKAGVESVEIEVELHDEDGRLIKYDAQTIPDMAISSQFDTAIETHLTNIIPLNNKHRAEISNYYGEKAHSNAAVKYSLSDSDGKQLTKEQQDYFKDSKMRDDNGNLKVMYHGSRDAGFHVFDPRKSDDDISFFFVDRNEVAATYSGTSETYEAKTIRTAEDMNNFLAEIGHDDYDVEEKDGRFFLYQDDDFVAKSDTAQGIYEEFCWYEGVGEGDANYKVYLNLKNPLEVDAEGRNWDDISREFYPELYEQWKTDFTQEEKDALVDLAGWEDFSTFKAEIERAIRDSGKPTADEYTKALDSAYWKNSDMSSLFSMAADNFSDEVLRAEAIKHMNTRDYAQRAKEQGYDGVIFKNLVDIGGYGNGREGAATVAIAFDSNQIKSVANENPTADSDIRYSISEKQNQNGLDIKSEVAYSLSNDTAYMDMAIAKNNSMMNVDSAVLEDTKALRERIAGRMNAIKDRGLVGLPEDIEGNTYIANSSYDGTEENTTICPRSLASEAFVDAVSEYLGRPLTVNEQIYISQDLQGRSLTPECTYCYVATDRKAYRAFLGEYVAQRDAVLQKVQENPNTDVSRSGELYKEFLNGRKDTNPMYSRFKMWVDAYKNGKPMIDASHLANINKLMGDINSEFGAELKPQIVDAMKYAQSASWAKKRVNYVAYNGHILKWKQDRINKLNSHYGLRMYSFSDFHPAFVLENMQMITDASVRGLKMLGYTKDTDFVEIFAPSGMNINVSTFGFESGGEVFENNLIGAEWEKAKALRDQYPNVGITFVATNDTLVEWALSQDWIDVVIPYHLVRTGTEVAKAFNYTNYTSESSDTKTKEWKKGDKKYIAPTEHNNDKATYLDALAKNHLQPRFERFIDDPNYMKLVNECRQPASLSKPVQPVFNEDAAMVALAKLEANGYYQPIGGSVDRMYEIAAEVAENMSKQIAPAMSLSSVGEQHTSDSLSALRLQTAEDSTDIAPISKMETTTPTISEMESVDVAPVAPLYESNDKSAPEGQTTMFEPVEEPPKRTTRKEYHQNIIKSIKSIFKGKGFDFEEVLKNAKNLSTWSTVDNTPQRVMEKSLGYKEGGILADITVNKVAQNESEGIKWLNSYVAQLKQISKQYGIKPGSKESAAAQMYAEGFYVNDKNEIIRYGDPELIQDFGNGDVRRRIKALARDPRIRKIYDDTLANINEARTRNLYPEIPRLENYFLHFRAMEDTFSTLGLPFNPNDIRAKDLPTDLNGVTADLKPGQPYFASAMHRKGKRTSFDLLGGVERYLNSAKNQIYHIDDIQTLRALRNYIAETYGQASGLEDIDVMTDAEAEERINQVYGAHLSTFAKFLNEEANVLAGKTALIDRGVEGIIGRRGITFLNTLNKQVGSNMVGYNVSSSLTNFLPVAQTFAKTNKFDFTKAFAQTVANKLSGGKFDSFAEDSPVVIRRKGEDRFYRTLWQKIADPGYALMGAVDDISTEIIARTKYNEFTRKGMDSQKAHFETDKWVSKLMGDRSLGQQPQLYNSKMLGLITKFQLEVRNQLDSQFYDTIQETKVSNEHIQNGLARNAKTAARVASVFTQLAVAQHLYGLAFESIAGYNPAFDIIEVLMTAFGFDDEEDSEDTALDNFAQGLLALAEDLPYVGTFTGGRIPISDALPDVPAILRGEDEYGNEIGIPEALVENVKDIAPYYLMPGGYGQLKKTKAGLGMFSDDHPIAGSYTDAGNLRFPVEDTIGSRIKAGVFGQYANENARKYFDQERKTLKPEEAEILAGLDIPIEEYWEYRDKYTEYQSFRNKLWDAADADDATVEDIVKSRYISVVNSELNDLYKQQKEIASGDSENKQSELSKIQTKMEKLISDSKYAERKTIVSGIYAEVGDRRFNYNADKDFWYEIKPKNSDGSSNKFYQMEQKVTEAFGISFSDYWNNKDEYDYAYEKPEKYAVAKSVGGYTSYRTYSSELWDIKADKDENGKSISGSRKDKVIDYINNLDADYGEKIILFKSEYPADDTYNMEIIDYLNSRDDISAQEMKTILEELDFKVDSDGNISW